MKLATIGFGAFAVGTLYLISELWRDLVEQDVAHGDARLRAARETQDVRQALGCLADRIETLEGRLDKPDALALEVSRVIGKRTQLLAAAPKPRARKAKP